MHTPEPAAVGHDPGKRRRLAIIVGIAVAVTVASTSTNAYSERRVVSEDARIRRAAAEATVSSTFVLDAIFSPLDDLASQLEVSTVRMDVTVEDGQACVEVQSDYVAAHRTASFSVVGETLVPIDRC